jgi:hypothetical protein
VSASNGANSIEFAKSCDQPPVLVPKISYQICSAIGKQRNATKRFHQHLFEFRPFRTCMNCDWRLEEIEIVLLVEFVEVSNEGKTEISPLLERF